MLTTPIVPPQRAGHVPEGLLLLAALYLSLSLSLYKCLSLALSLYSPQYIPPNRKNCLLFGMATPIVPPRGAGQLPAGVVAAVVDPNTTHDGALYIKET